MFCFFCGICVLVSSAYPEHYLVGVCNEFRSPSAYWPATAIRYCADQTRLISDVQDRIDRHHIFRE